jgi:hypothetical protein
MCPLDFDPNKTLRLSSGGQASTFPISTSPRCYSSRRQASGDDSNNTVIYMYATGS